MPPESKSPSKPPRAKPGAVPGEIYFEFVTAGAYVKVTAIDAATGIEAAIVGAARASQPALEQAALAKLRFVLAKKNGGA